MADYLYIPSVNGGYGTMPDYETRLFSNEQEYREAYDEEVDEIVDELASAFGPVDYPDEDAWFEYA